MYRVTIYNDGIPTVIQEPLSSSVRLIRGDLKKGINTFESLDMTMLPNNPGHLRMRPFKTMVEVLDTLNNQEVFYGQVINPSEYMDASGEFGYDYLCAHYGSFLQDTIQNWYRASNMSPDQFFRYVIGVHNSQVLEDYKKFTVGRVTVTNSTDNVYRYVDDTATTWETIMDKLVDRLGGEIQFRREGGVNYVDYLQEIGEKRESTIALTQNMISFSRDIDPTDVVTVFKPRGARQESTNPSADYNASDPRLTIAIVNDGKDYLLANQALINEFGYRTGSRAYDDINNANVLKTRGQQFLDGQKAALIKYNVSAADLSLLNLAPDRFKVGDWYPTRNEVLGVNEDLRITGMTIDLVQPQTSVLNIGDKTTTLSQYQNSIRKTAQRINDITSNLQGLSTGIANVDREIQNVVVSVENVINQSNAEFGELNQAINDLNQAIGSIPTYELATTTTNGLMSYLDKIKLNSLQNYQLATILEKGLMSAPDKVKLNLITVTEGIDLDNLNARITALENDQITGE